MGRPKGGGVPSTEGVVGEPPQVHYIRDLSVPEGGADPSTEEGAELQDFTPTSLHLLLQVVYEDFLHHNDGTRLTGGVSDDAAWKSCWLRLAAQSARWYSTHPSKVVRWFTAVLALE